MKVGNQITMTYYVIKATVIKKSGSAEAYWNTDAHIWCAISSIGAALFREQYFYGGPDPAKKDVELFFHRMVYDGKYKLSLVQHGISIVRYDDTDHSETVVSELRWKDIDPNDGWVD